MQGRTDFDARRLVTATLDDAMTRHAYVPIDESYNLTLLYNALIKRMKTVIIEEMRQNAAAGVYEVSFRLRFVIVYTTNDHGHRTRRFAEMDLSREITIIVPVTRDHNFVWRDMIATTDFDHFETLVRRMRDNKFGEWQKRYDGIVDDDLQTGITRVYMTVGRILKVADEATRRQRRREQREQEEEKKAQDDYEQEEEEEEYYQEEEAPPQQQQRRRRRGGNNWNRKKGGRRAHMIFDFNLKMARYSTLGQRTPFFDTDGICILEALEFIRKDGQQQGLQNSCHLVRQEELMSFVRTTFTDQEELQAFYIGDIFRCMQSYKKHFPELDFGFYNVHTDEALDIDAEGNVYPCEHKVHVPEEVPHKEIEVLVFDTSEGEAAMDTDELSPLVDEKTHDSAYYKSDPFWYCTELPLTPETALSHKWWLTYERMHVLPIARKQLLALVVEQKARCRKRELKHAAKQAKQDAKLAQEKKRKKKDSDVQPIESDKPYQVMKTCMTEEVLLQKCKDLKKKTGVCREKVAVMFDYQLNEEQIEVAKARINKRMDKYGVCALDIETVIDNSVNADLVGNTVPIVLCLWGTLYFDSHVFSQYRQKWDSLADNNCIYPDAMSSSSSRVQLMHVNIAFKGMDVVDQFVTWCLETGVIMQQQATKKCTKKTAKSSAYVRDYQNIFVAHNGVRFDFRFLIDKFSRVANINMIGSIEKMKQLRYKNLSFVDFYMLLPFSLASVCKSMKCVQQKFPYDIENVTALNWQSKEAQIVKYCLQDCMALHEAYTKFVRTRATTYYDGRGFPKQLFPITQSSASLDVMQSCFMEYQLCTYPSLLQIEQQSYVGGICLPFGTSMKFGVSVDINSSYPAAMHNLMPLRPMKVTDKRLRSEQCKYIAEMEFAPLCVVSRTANPSFYAETIEFYKNTYGLDGDIADMPIAETVPDVSLNLVTFEFPATANYPSLIVKEQDNLVMPLSSCAIKQWIWGVQINFAVQEQGARVIVHKQIQYEQAPVFKRFVEYLYDQRLAAKAANNDVLSQIHKLELNGGYGKLGQKITPKVLYGHKQYLQDVIVDRQNSVKFGSTVQVLGCKNVVSVNDKLVEVKYTEGDECQTQIGSLVRFASYITALARTNLFRGIELIQRAFKDQCLVESQTVRYVDTDSIHVSVEEGFTEEQKMRLEYLEKITEAGSLIIHALQQKRTTIEKWSVLAKENLLNETLIEEVLATVSQLHTKTIPNIQHVVAAHVAYREASGGDLIDILAKTQDCGRVVNDLLEESIELNVQAAPELSLLYQIYKQGQKCVQAISDTVGQIKKKMLLSQTNEVLEMFAQNRLYSALTRVMDQDPRHLKYDGFENTYPQVPLLDERVCGAFKIEKYITRGIYLGAKQYAVRAFDTDRGSELTTTCKMKGVHYLKRRYEHYEEVLSQLTYLDFNSSEDSTFQDNVCSMVAAELSDEHKMEFVQKYVHKYSQTNFRVLHSGVRIHTHVKYVTPTLTKRKYFGCQSQPFETTVEWSLHREAQRVINARIKSMFKYQCDGDALMTAVTTAEHESSRKDLELERMIILENKLDLFEDSEDEYSNDEGPINSEGKSHQEHRMAIDRPFLFNKLSLLQKIVQMIADGRLSVEQVETLFKQSVTTYVKEFMGKITGNTCKQVIKVEKALVYAHFTTALADIVFSSGHNPYAEVRDFIVSCVRNVGKSKLVHVNKELLGVVIADFESLTDQLKRCGSAAGTLLAASLCQLAKNVGGWSEKGKRHTMYDVGDLTADLTRKAKARIVKETAQIQRFIAKNSQMRATESNNVVFMLVKTELLRMYHEGALQYVQDMYKQQLAHGRSLYPAVLYVIRNGILFDETVLQGSWDKRYDYKKMSMNMRNFLELVANSFLSSDALDLSKVGGSFGVTHSRAEWKQFDDFVAELLKATYEEADQE